MSEKQIIIDGYNLIKINQAQFPPDLSLEQQREHLLRLLHSSPHFSGKQITVVFDGAQPVLPASRFRYRGIRVLFSGKGATADDAIRRMIRNSPHPEEILVVTSDREIQFTARDLGSAVAESRHFWKQLTAHSTTTPSPETEAQKDRELSQREVEEWLELVRQRRESDED